MSRGSACSSKGSSSGDVGAIGLQTDTKLPLFVFPTSLCFYTDDSASHQQVLTLYNPYNFSLNYKVLSTAPKKYRVTEAEGTIKPRCCTDICVRHREICISNEHVCDKLRLQVCEVGQKTVIGRKDIVSKLLPTREPQSAQWRSDEDFDGDQFESLPTQQVSPRVATATLSGGGGSHTAAAESVHTAAILTQRRQPQSSTIQPAHGRASVGPSWVVLLVTLLCIIVLMLPLHDDQQRSSTLHSAVQYFTVSVHQKLIAAYILGLVTMVILHS